MSYERVTVAFDLRGCVWRRIHLICGGGYMSYERVTVAFDQCVCVCVCKKKEVSGATAPRPRT